MRMTVRAGYTLLWLLSISMCDIGQSKYFQSNEQIRLLAQSGRARIVVKCLLLGGGLNRSTQHWASWQ